MPDSLEQKVEHYFYEVGDACGECMYCHSSREPHGEILSFCKLLELGQNFNQCPGIWDN